MDKTASRIEVVETGLVFASQPGQDRAVAVGSRLCRLNGQLLCSFMRQSQVGVNDFVPVISRSGDNGRTWSPPEPIWPHLADRASIFVNISNRPDAQGRLHVYGLQSAVTAPGEPIWQQSNHGLRANELIHAASDATGQSWDQPQPIARSTLGAVEAPGALCVMTSGRLYGSYSPYNTFDTTIHAPHHELVGVYSDDGGRNWQFSTIMSFTPETDGTAESWVIELESGRLLSSCWRMNYADGSDYPTPLALSDDQGRTWSAPQSPGISGQSVGLAPLAGDRALMVYNRRRQTPPGVAMAIIDTKGGVVRVVADQLIWQAGSPDKSGNPKAESLADWTSFGFGEPAVLMLSPKEALVVLWCDSPSLRGIVSVRVRLS